MRFYYRVCKHTSNVEADRWCWIHLRLSSEILYAEFFFISVRSFFSNKRIRISAPLLGFCESQTTKIKFIFAHTHIRFWWRVAFLFFRSIRLVWTERRRSMCSFWGQAENVYAFLLSYCYHRNGHFLFAYKERSTVSANKSSSIKSKLANIEKQ